MSEDLHHIDDIFKKGLEGNEDTPSQQVWKKIEAELDKKDSKRPFIFFRDTRKIAVILMICLGSAGLFAGGYLLRGLQMQDAEPKNIPAIENKKSDRRDSTDTDGSTQSLEKAVASSNIREGQQTEKALDQAVIPERKNNPPNTDRHKAVANPSVSSPSTEKTPETKLATDKTADAEKISEPSSKSNTAGTKRTQDETSSEPSSKSNSAGMKRTDDEKSTKNLTSAPAAKQNGSSVNPNAPSIEAATEADKYATRSAAEVEAKPEQTETPTQFEMAAAPPVISNRSLPIAEKQLGNDNALTDQVQAIAASASIPVLNKKQGNINLPKFSMTPVAALQFGSNRIKENKSYPNSGTVKNDIQRTESQPSSIAGGLLADLRISRNMTLQSGLIYISRTIQIDPKKVIAERNPDGKVRYRFDCSAGTYFIKKAQGYTRPGDTTMTKFSTNDLNYLNIPLSLTYHFGGSKFHVFAMAGAGLNLLTRQYLETGLKYGYYEAEETKVTNLKNSYFNGNIGLGISWSAFRKVSFNLNPQYQFALTPMNSNMPIKAYPRVFNLQAGMQIRL